MFMWVTITLSILLSFVQVLTLSQSFLPCMYFDLFMTRYFPSNEDNYWFGAFRSNQSEVRITLQLTAPADIIVNPDLGGVFSRNNKFYMAFFPTEGKEEEVNHYHFKVLGEEGEAFPNIKSFIMNSVDVCPNPKQWDVTVKKLDKDNKFHCGQRPVNPQSLIKGGELTKEGDWPWHAAIFHQEGSDRYVYKCGGTLLNTNTILTAAHCVTQTGRFIVPDRVLVKLGLHHRFIAGTNAQEFQVHKIHPHENFNLTFYYNDIAILKLSTEATYTNYVKPVCLWPANTDISVLIGRPGDVIGWGFYDQQNKASEYLGYATMPIVSTFVCLHSNRDFFGQFISDRSFCAGYRNGTSVCNGDSGGGMFLKQNGFYSVRGIVSVSVSLDTEQVCDPHEYVIFTDVAQYLDWIKQKL